MKQAAGTTGTLHVLRLQPGEDVREMLDRWAKDNAIEAAAVVSAVGSLSTALIRYANRADGMATVTDLEVCAFSGTLSKYGVHLHISVADREGRMLGGHVLAGCIVRTTLELVLQEISGVRMLRARDATTTYDELDPQGIRP